MYLGRILGIQWEKGIGAWQRPNKGVIDAVGALALVQASGISGIHVAPCSFKAGLLFLCILPQLQAWKIKSLRHLQFSENEMKQPWVVFIKKGHRCRQGGEQRGSHKDPVGELNSAPDNFQSWSQKLLVSLKTWNFMVTVDSVTWQQKRHRLKDHGGFFLLILHWIEFIHESWMESFYLRLSKTCVFIFN